MATTLQANALIKIDVTAFDNTEAMISGEPHAHTKWENNQNTGEIDGYTTQVTFLNGPKGIKGQTLDVHTDDPVQPDVEIGDMVTLEIDDEDSSVYVANPRGNYSTLAFRVVAKLTKVSD
jgi:hypothetical protein